MECENCGKEIPVYGKFGEEYKSALIREFGKVLCDRCAKKDFLNRDSVKKDIEFVKKELKDTFGLSDEEIEKEINKIKE